MPERNALAPRPTTYKGVGMRSRLEASYAQWLDAAGIAWTYEPRCFADETGQYLPDFQLHGVHVDGAERLIYVETKPTTQLIRDAHVRMRRILSSEPDACLMIEVPAVSAPFLLWCGEWAGYVWANGAPPTLVRTTAQLARRWKP